MQVYHGVAELKAALGTEIAPSPWLTVDQPTIDGFADVTRDHQWIHVDAARAADGPYGATIAHGFLTLSLLPYLVSSMRTIDGARMGINDGLDKVRIPAPVTGGSRIRARATMTDLVDVGGGVQLTTRVSVEAEGSDKPSCVANQLSRCHF